jgi:hypothetical protein
MASTRPGRWLSTGERVVCRYQRKVSWQLAVFMTNSTADWGALQRSIDGDVVLPGSADYESVRKP